MVDETLCTAVTRFSILGEYIAMLENRPNESDDNIQTNHRQSEILLDDQDNILDPLITVAIPVFNERDAIIRAVHSVLHQSVNESIEILIVDDGSTDGTQNVVEKLSEKWPQIRFLQNGSNLGRAYTRSRLMKEARGKYYAMLDADDGWYPTKLRRQLDLMRDLGDRSNVMICGNLMHRDVDSGQSKVKDFSKAYGSNYSIRRLLIGDNIPISQVSFAHTDFLKSIGEFDVRLSRAQDWDFLIRFFLAGGEVAYVDGDPLALFNFTRVGRNWLEVSACMQLVVAKHLAAYKANDIDPHEVIAKINSNYVESFKALDSKKI